MLFHIHHFFFFVCWSKIKKKNKYFQINNGKSHTFLCKTFFFFIKFRYRFYFPSYFNLYIVFSYVHQWSRKFLTRYKNGFYNFRIRFIRSFIWFCCECFFFLTNFRRSRNTRNVVVLARILRNNIINVMQYARRTVWTRRKLDSECDHKLN